MTDAEVALDTASPGAHEREVKRAADGGTGKRDQASHPLFCCFLAQLHSKPLCNAWRKFLEDLFLRKILTVINTSGRGGRHPQFQSFTLAVPLEAIKKAKPLNKPDGQNRQQSGIRNDRNHTAKTKSSAFQERKTLGVLDERPGNGIQSRHGHPMHMAEVRDVQPMFFLKMLAEFFAVDFDRAKPAQEPKSSKSPECPSRHRIM